MTKYRRIAIERADGRQWRTIWTITQSFAHSHFISWLQTLPQSVFNTQAIYIGCPYSVCSRLSKWPLNKSWKTIAIMSLTSYQLTNNTNLPTSGSPICWHSVWCHSNIIWNASVNESITILQWSLICIFYVCSAVTVMAEAHKCLIRKEEYLQYKWRQKLHFYISCFLKKTWSQYFAYVWLCL